MPIPKEPAPYGNRLLSYRLPKKGDSIKSKVLGGREEGAWFIDVKSVVTSNVATENNEDLVINYDSYIDRTEEYSDNTSLMLLKVLQRIGITSFAIAGFDGFKEQGSYFNENNYKEVRFSSKYDEINKAISKLLKKYADREFNKQVQNYEMFL